MNLRWVHIKNFRSCKDIKVFLGPMHALVGANNAGKSTILRALDFLFNPSATKIDEESFWNKDTSEAIWIEAFFDDLTLEEKEKLQGYLRPDNNFHIARSASVEKSPEETESSSSSGEMKIIISQHFCKPMPKYDWLNPSTINGASIAEWWNRKDELVANGANFSDLLGNTKPGVTVWKEKANEFSQQQLLESDYQEFWSDNPSGYAGVLKGIIPHFILVPAVRDLSDEAKVTKTNPLGRLLYAVIEEVSEVQRDTIEKSLDKMAQMLNKSGGSERLTSITETEKRLNDVLREYMECDLEIEFQTPRLEAILTTPKIFADDGFRNIVENKGHGLQRAIIFSILRCYSELITGKGNDKKRAMIFAVEEPELYMHPQAQRTIRRVFKTISENRDQVIFSTHSPLLLDVSDFDQIIRVYAIQETTNGNKVVKSHVWQITMKAMIQDVEIRHPGLKASDESIRELYSNAYHPMRAEGFFAKKIILVEGATEQYALPIYAEAEGYHLDNLNISVVDCGGKGCMDRLYRIFNELGIPCFLIIDYDNRSTNAEMLAKSKELLQLFGQSPDPPENIFISDCIACFPSNWEGDLAREIPDLAELTTEARSKLGLKDDSGKPLIARYVAKSLTSRNPPEIPDSLKVIIRKAVDVPWTKSCLVSCDS